MFTASLIVLAALIYFALLAMMLAYVAGVSRAGGHPEHCLRDGEPEFHPHSPEPHVRRVA